MDGFIALDKNKNHFLQPVHDMPGFLRNFILKKIAASITPEAVAGGVSQAELNVFYQYYYKCLERPGKADIMLQQPFFPPAYAKNPMQGENRLCSSKCTFPIAYAFGD